MEEAGGGWMWFLVDVIMVVLLGGAIVYGYLQWKRKRETPRDKREESEAIKDVYRQDTK